MNKLVHIDWSCNAVVSSTICSFYVTRQMEGRMRQKKQTGAHHRSNSEHAHNDYSYAQFKRTKMLNKMEQYIVQNTDNITKYYKF